MTKNQKKVIWLFHTGAVFLNIIFLISLFSYSAYDEVVFVNSLQEPWHNAFDKIGFLVSSKALFVFGLAIYPLAIVTLISLIYYLQFEVKDYFLYIVSFLCMAISLTILLTINPAVGNLLASNLNLAQMTGGVIGAKLANPDSGLLYSLISVGSIQFLKFISIIILMLSCYFLYRLMRCSTNRLSIEKEQVTVEDESLQENLFEDFEVKKPLDNSQKEVFVEDGEKTLNKNNSLVVGDEKNVETKEIPSIKIENISQVGETKKLKNNSMYKLPKVNLLTEPIKGKVDFRQETKERYEALEKALQDFNIKGKIGGATRGPRVTLFEVIPEKGTPINSISKHSENFAINMRARNVRIAALPERGTIGIEVPNKSSEAVGFSELLKSPEWKKSTADIPICLGKNISNDSVIMDLARAPHLLIAGATGAGKSVFMNTLILSLIYKFSPDELNLVMVDPKFVEFAAYEKLPHLICPVITDSNKAPVALRWATFEMDCRYKLLAATKSKNINSFNSRTITKDSPREDSEGNPIPDKLPYLVVIIDELADLMMMAKKDIETSIARVAQKGRAAGVHLVVATQRPSVDVITGLIKANFPTRIAFQVSSAIDSRTILESTGAEKLLGQGDMLFTPPGASGIQRIQGAYVPDDDILTVVDVCGKQKEANFIDIFSKMHIESDDGSTDPSGEQVKDKRKIILYQQAVDIILRDKRVSVSHIQRRLSIGYNSAANIVEGLEALGYISESLDGKGSRDIYITSNPYDKEEGDE